MNFPEIKNSSREQFEVVTIKDEIESYYLIVNSENIKIKFPENLVYDNELEINNNKLKLTKTIYKYWFKRYEKLIKDTIYNFIYSNLKIIIENKEIVFKNENYSSIFTDKLFYSNYPIPPYTHSISLGAWLNSFDILESEVSDSQGYKHEVLVITSIVGSPSTGRNSCSGWSIEKQKIVRGNSSYRFYKIRENYKEIAHSYLNKKLTTVEVAMQVIALSKELGVETPKEFYNYICIE